MNKKNKKNKFFQGSPKNLLLVAFLFVVGLMVLTKLTDYTREVQDIIYSDFEKKVTQGLVEKVYIADQEVSGDFKDGGKFQTIIAQDPSIWELLKKNNVAVSVGSSAGKMGFWYLFSLIPLIFLIVAGLSIFYFFQSRGSGGNAGSNIFSMGKSKARMFMPSSIKENFDSVAGAAEAKEELKDVVDFLKSPEKYRRLGAKITRGVLLVGEPGNGKTLLARAVAGEANCPFFSISGSDFIEVFVGVGASRVRDLFSQARQNAPSIIFIDEMDAVGRQRGSGLGGGHDEREQTLNQLLTEMDGFQVNEGSVIVIAATNRPDVLDKALLRPGRFDRQVEVPFPDLVSREQILRVHAKGVKISPEVDLKKIARGTPGFSGADLANLINEAALNATKNVTQELVTTADFEEARDKITLGKESKTKIFTPEERKVTAYHEAGHALVRLLLPKESDPLHKVTIVPRGRALGVTHWLPERERYTESKDRMFATLQSCLGGRAAEELVFNVKETGAYSDFVAATSLARKMVCSYGMSDTLGPVIYKQQYGEYKYSEKTAERIDAEVQTLLETALKEAHTLLESNRDKLDALAQALVEKETLYAGEIYTLLGIEPREEHSFS